MLGLPGSGVLVHVFDVVLGTALGLAALRAALAFFTCCWAVLPMVGQRDSVG